MFFQQKTLDFSQKTLDLQRNYDSSFNRTERLSPAKRIESKYFVRGIAQLGSARRSGRRGRRFKSGYPDKKQRLSKNRIGQPLFL